MEEALDRIDAASLKPLHAPTAKIQIKGYRLVGPRPVELASKYQIPVDTYTLARVLTSEAGKRATAAERLAIAEAVRNYARKRGISILKACTYHATRPYASIRYGEQAGRFCSTYQDPTHRDLVAAKIALEEGTDIATGATHWIHPAAQARGSQAGRKIPSVAEIVRRRRASGLFPVAVAGVPTTRLLMFGPKLILPTPRAIEEEMALEKEPHRIYALFLRLLAIFFGYEAAKDN